MTGITVKELLSAEGTLAEKLLCSVTYPFEALKKIGDYIKEIGPALDKEIYEDDVYVKEKKISTKVSFFEKIGKWFKNLW